MHALPTTLVALILLASSTPHAAPLAPLHQVLRCLAPNSTQRAYIAANRLDVWRDDQAVTDVRVEGIAQKKALLATGVRCHAFLDNVNELLAVETDRGGGAGLRQTDGEKQRKNDDAFFDTYRSGEEIAAQIQKWARKYPMRFTDLGSIGTTYEGRAIPAYKISSSSTDSRSSSSNSTQRQSVWINAGLHAREWISTATALFITHTLLTDAALSTPLLAHTDVYVTPLANPDGYAYTRNTTIKADNRMWRKNRQPNPTHPNCPGTDLNRNWDEHWARVGASTSDPCDETYAGTHAFSTAETRALAQFAQSLPYPRGAGVDLHAYGQYILRPWGWTLAQQPARNAVYHARLAEGIRGAILDAGGVAYTAESGAQLYPASGAADDWINARLGMVGLTIELRDTGAYGFLLPARLIRVTGKEVVAGFTFLCRFLYEEGPPPEKLSQVVLHERQRLHRSAATL
ncbi:hypothetical protein BDZ88DRAFT_27512 [Geranomyces variabilis]|nr:hypothetical protein BDZ88DRAFT_27512 [Geranomyces variabilis]KAJ3133252.1 hypothetical protein HDU90_006409 [Geranomyces variabilis]